MEGLEKLISFFSHALMDVELKYNLVKKQPYALVKALNSFQIYVLHSKVIDFMPNITVKDVLLQPDIDGRRGISLTNILEFYIEIRPTKLIKGQGLAHLMEESNCRYLNLKMEIAEEINKEGRTD